jgi:hypothetical protein
MFKGGQPVVYGWPGSPAGEARALDHNLHPVSVHLLGLLTTFTLPLLLPQATRTIGTVPCDSVGISSALFELVDTALARVDARSGPPASPVARACTSLMWRGRRLIAMTVAGGDERSGGVAVIDPTDDSILSAMPYAAARDPHSAGNGRLLLTYTRFRDLPGAGQYEADFVLLCGVGPDMWLECLELTKDRISVVMGEVAPRRIEQHNSALLRGDTLLYSRAVTLRADTADPLATRSLGTLKLLLPPVP